MKKISVVIPARNEEGSLDIVLKDLLQVEQNLKEFTFENIVVDDNSFDKTADIAKKRLCRVIRNDGKSGKGSALRLGFKASNGDYIIMLDADYSHRLEDIPLFLERLEKGAGMVIGSRIFGGSDEYTRVRAFGNLFLTWIFGFFYGRYLSDALNGFKAFRKEVFVNHKYNSTGFEIEIELLVNTLRSGFTIAEIPSHERSRISGKAKSRVIEHGFMFFFRIIWEWSRDKLGLLKKQNDR